MSEEITIPVTMSALCRYCLARKQDLQPIFDGNAALLRKINDIIQLEINQDDGLPSNICQQCIFQLNTAHCFKQRCISSETKLKAFVAQMSQSGIDNLMDLFPLEHVDNESDSETEFDIPLCEVVYTDPHGGSESIDQKHSINRVSEPSVGTRIADSFASDTKVKIEIIDHGANKSGEVIEKKKRIRSTKLKPEPEPEPEEDKTLSDEPESEDDIRSNHSDPSYDEVERETELKKIKLKKQKAAQKKKESKNLPVICEICGKLFKKNHLYYHRKLHTAERQFVCTLETCKKSFKMLSHLKRHTRLHDGEKSFLCSFCGKSFIDSSNLRNHVRNHRQERNHPCVTCGKAFARAETLTKHLRSHTGEKPYSCEICQRFFPRKDSLIRHLKSHRGERPHQCNVCDRSFTQSYDLKLHIRKHLARQI